MTRNRLPLRTRTWIARGSVPLVVAGSVLLLLALTAPSDGSREQRGRGASNRPRPGEPVKSSIGRGLSLSGAAEGREPRQVVVRVTAPDGSPHSNLNVGISVLQVQADGRWASVRNSAGLPAFQHQSTSGSGVAVFSHVPEGRLAVQVVLPAFLRAVDRRALHRELGPRDRIAHFDISAPAQQTAKGRVLRLGMPGAGANVEMQDDAWEGRERQSASLLADGDGYFAFPVSCSPRAWLRARMTVGTEEWVGVTYWEPGVAGATIVLHPRCEDAEAPSVRVLDGGLGEIGWRVVAVNGEHVQSMRAIELRRRDGRLNLAGMTPPLWVEVWRRGGHPDVQASGVALVGPLLCGDSEILTLPRGSVTDVRMVDEVGDPVNGVAVCACLPWDPAPGQSSIAMLSEGVSDADGRVRLLGVSEVACRLVVQTPDTFAFFPSRLVPAGGVPEVLEIQHGVRAEVLVRDVFGEPLHGVWVEATEGGGRPDGADSAFSLKGYAPAGAFTDRSGRAFLEKLDPRKAYRLVANPVGSRGSNWLLTSTTVEEWAPIGAGKDAQSEGATVLVIGYR